jgi:hypothetical protein
MLCTCYGRRFCRSGRICAVEKRGRKFQKFRRKVWAFSSTIFSVKTKMKICIMGIIGVTVMWLFQHCRRQISGLLSTILREQEHQNFRLWAQWLMSLWSRFIQHFLWIFCWKTIRNVYSSGHDWCQFDLAFSVKILPFDCKYQSKIMLNISKSLYQHSWTKRGGARGKKCSVTCEFM